MDIKLKIEEVTNMKEKKTLEEQLKNNILYHVDCDVGFFILLAIVLFFFPTYFTITNLLENISLNLPNTIFYFLASALPVILLILYLIFFTVHFAIFIDNLILRIRNKDINEHLILTKTVSHGISLTSLFVTTILLILNMLAPSLSYLLPFIFVADILYILFLLRKKLDFCIIADGISEIVNGNMTYKLEEIPFTYLQVGNQLNQISERFSQSIEEQLKSEKLKTDLITNVSHDLRTPLTSVINYIALLKKEKIVNPKVGKYLKVLEIKAEKLKNLTEDLIDISKLNSGNESILLEKVNFSEMVLQANGEFAEKFDQLHLKIISKTPEHAVLLAIDSRKMGRVLENLYGNIAKYAMPNTRVYIELVQTQDKIIFTTKNISKDTLNISADELTERFVRGDSSRSTAGSGLGLAITKSLIQLHGGTFELFVDGDLFRVKFQLPIITL